MEYGPTTLIKE